LQRSNAEWEALETINHYRAVHYYPLNTFKVTLRRKAESIDPDRLVAQRIKLLSSIHAKLARFSTIRLSQMQDIGGYRAIVGTTDHAFRAKLKSRLICLDEAGAL
jgi:ppGpp synthetase/RelA/SpoT-type nucleotidyltranferase